MSARRAGAVDGATGSTAKADGSNTGKQPQSGSKLGSQDELLKLARDMGHTTGEPLRLGKEASGSEESEEQEEQEEPVTDETEDSVEESETEDEEESGSESDEEEGQAEGEAESEEEEEETEDEEEEGGRKSIDDQIKALKKEGKEVPWYFTRISKLTRQKGERDTQIATITNQARALYQENQSLKERIQSGGTTASTDDPLGNCFTEADLQKKASEAEKHLAWCERNRNGGEITVGDNTYDLDEDQVVDLKLGCEKILREGISNRRKYLTDRFKMDSKAVEIYPDYRDATSAFRQEADDILRAFPILQKVPDVRIWIGHAIAGRNAYLAKLNGKGKLKPSSTSKILKSAKTKVAPTTAKTRGFSPRSGSVDKETAKKNLESKGDAASAEKFLETIGIGGGRSSKVERVEA